MRINLANTRLFRGMEPTDIDGMLGCLHAKEQRVTLPAPQNRP